MERVKWFLIPKVLHIFTSYYEALLSPTDPGSSLQSDSWLASISPPTLSEEQVRGLNSLCSEQEILSIIKALKTSKAPGSDGFTQTYYKEFAGTLVPKLSNHLIISFRGHKLPDEMLYINMTLISKPNKDHSVPQNYRPISVLNNDLKI